MGRCLEVVKTLVGIFTIDGKIDLKKRTVYFEKKYLGMHLVVYRVTIKDNLVEMTGKWFINEYNGLFRMSIDKKVSVRLMRNEEDRARLQVAYKKTENNEQELLKPLNSINVIANFLRCTLWNEYVFNQYFNSLRDEHGHAYEKWYKIVCELQFHHKWFYNNKKTLHEICKRARLFELDEVNIAYEYAKHNFGAEVKSEFEKSSNTTDDIPLKYVDDKGEIILWPAKSKIKT
ncbi:hypothetical protein RFI_27491 [Reticulomyxa filosa]|uniref:Uncharacterized protein n=1 Tax=Reticulomyxa filosa TaxID=46433 RepID=X6M8F0_RETFI|nr:hypothetical protein RFI_27491 [Reticulomyxa filosa]|eukprot:ETO09886.1 hypothetical protein RFI_27491 [Reticulomyxa filosa]